MPVSIIGWGNCMNCSDRQTGQLFCSCHTATTSASTLTITQTYNWTPIIYGTTGNYATSGSTFPRSQIWITVTTGGSYDYRSWNNQPTAEQLAEQRRRRAAEAAEYEQRMARRMRAIARAEELLLSLLTEQQGRSYRELGWFELVGSAGGIFRINRRGQAGNVDELPAPGEDRIASWCCHPPGGFPDADAHIGQYLQLVTDEPEFRRIGNMTPRRRLPVRIAA